MNKIGSWKDRLGEGLGVNLPGKFIVHFKMESMIDIFSEEYRFQKFDEIMDSVMKTIKSNTPEQNLQDMMEMGICDENGNLLPEYQGLPQFLTELSKSWNSCTTTGTI